MMMNYLMEVKGFAHVMGGQCSAHCCYRDGDDTGGWAEEKKHGDGEATVVHKPEALHKAQADRERLDKDPKLQEQHEAPPLKAEPPIKEDQCTEDEEEEDEVQEEDNEEVLPKAAPRPLAAVVEATARMANEAEQERRIAECKEEQEVAHKDKEEAERKAKEEAARVEAERKVKEEAERKAKEEAAAAAKTAKEADRKIKEEAAHVEAERKAKEEAARMAEEA